MLRGALVAAVVLFGCGGGPSSEDPGQDHEDELHGKETGAGCPDGSGLTYANFGRSFMSLYCTRCHGSDVQGTSREDAPENMNFDTLAAIRAQAAEIDEHAAAGPMSANRAMPPSDPIPSDGERRMLGEWLSCGAP